MRVKVLVALAAMLAIAVPAEAKAGGFHGIVIAKQPQRGTLVLAGPTGVGMTVHASTARMKIGDRISLQGRRLVDGTILGSQLRVVSHVQRASIRAVVVRQLRTSTLAATGRSVFAIRNKGVRAVASAADGGGLRPGSIEQFEIEIEDNGILQAVATTPAGQAGNVQIEGALVSTSPFVVTVGGLPITITVPTGMTLPTTLAAGQRIELTVQTAAANVFTLVSIDQVEAVDQPGRPGEEVEVRGTVTSSTATQIVVSNGGALFTFAAPTGVTLPTLSVGTSVEARGTSVNGMLTLERLKLEDSNGDGGGGLGGDHGGGGGD